MTAVGPIGRLGRWTAGHIRLVVIVWAVVAIGLGALAPRADHALSGAGWEARVGVRRRAGRDRRVVRRSGRLRPDGGRPRSGQPRRDRRRGEPPARVRLPRVLGRAAAGLEGRSDGPLSGGAAASPTEMVRAADDLKGKLADLSHGSTTVSLTGAPGMWSDFNEANKSAMLKSEIISWPVTLAILLLAFGSLVAAGLPLLLTILGLMASAGSLFLITHLFDVSIWSMNFALMFALALGIDYALFIVARFRGAHFGSQSHDPRRGCAHDGHGRQGGAVLRRHRPDLAVGGDARPEPGVPLDGARDQLSVGIHPPSPRSRCCPPCSRGSATASTGSRCRGATPASIDHRGLPGWGELLWRRPALLRRRPRSRSSSLLALPAWAP